MKKITSVIIGLWLFSSIIPGVLAQTRELGASGELLDGIAALVNSGVVLKSDVANRIPVAAEGFIQQQLQLPPEQRSQLPPVSVFEDAVLEQLILEEIQMQRAGRMSIQIGDDDLNLVLAEYARTVGTTLSEFPAWLESQGVSYQLFREEQRRDLTIRTLERAEVVNRIQINPIEFQQCIDQALQSQADQFEYNISHIVVDNPPTATPEQAAEAEATVREIEQQLSEGADFAELAVTYSDSQTALQGGSLGWRKGGALPDLGVDLRKLEVGEHTDVIGAAGGFHFFRLNDMRGTEPQLVDQIRVRHILLSPTEVLDDEATRQKLQGIRDQILLNDDFDTVAAAVSEDVRSAVNGGDLDWRPVDVFDEDFAAALADLEIGELSEPFQTAFGWHVAEVTGRRNYDMTDELRERDCETQIGNRKAGEELDIWRRRLIEDAYVVKRL